MTTKTDLEWEIYYELEDLGEELDHIFDLCKSVIRNSFWPVRAIFRKDREEKLQQEMNAWIDSHIGRLPSSDCKLVLEQNLIHVFRKNHDWFGMDDMPHTRDGMAELLLKLGFKDLLRALEETICYQCR